MRKPRWLAKAVLGVVAVLVLIQLVRPSRTNPVTPPSLALGAHGELQPEVDALLRRACADCHSNATVWPWYSHVAPISWLLVWDVAEGRRAVNFSEWERYAPSARRELLEESCEEVREGQMPPRTYVWMHPEAKLSPAERDALCAWTEQVR